MEESAQIAFAGEQDFLSAAWDGVYYAGSYRVGTELPEGEYFMLVWEFGVVTKENNNHIPTGGADRFRYITIEDAVIVNLYGCALFPVERKPEIRPIQYQGNGEGAGQLIYPAGTYKIGVDLPVGTYLLKNELFEPVTDLDYEGYHGSVTDYYPHRLTNWCGLSAGGGRHTIEADDGEMLGWLWMELDCRVGAKYRMLKIGIRTADGPDATYKHFRGLPRVTFTQEQIGACVSVSGCILLPLTDTA